MRCAHCQEDLALLQLFCSDVHRDAYRRASQQESRIAQFLQWLNARPCLNVNRRRTLTPSIPSQVFERTRTTEEART